MQSLMSFSTGWYEKIHYLIISKSYLKKIPLILQSDSDIKTIKDFFKRIYKNNFTKASSAIVAG